MGARVALSAVFHQGQKPEPLRNVFDPGCNQFYKMQFYEAHLLSFLRAEPHEICGEDNFSNVVWKMTPAGDTAAVRCPPNAMGELTPYSTLDSNIQWYF